jgi:hypothetical protein
MASFHCTEGSMGDEEAKEKGLNVAPEEAASAQA